MSVINKHGSVTVKDVAAKEFIEVFAKHLKKSNKFKIPEVFLTLFHCLVVPIRQDRLLQGTQPL